MSKPWAILGLIVGISGLCLQFYLSIPAYLADGIPIWTALIKFFSYFTIQTNIILLLIYISSLVHVPAIGLFARPPTRVMAAALITLVMLFYHFILAPEWAPEGLWKIADSLLHYATPLIYLFWFAVLRYSTTVGISVIPKMLIYPVLYVAYVLARGAVTNDYPYEIFNPNNAGYSSVLISCAALLVGIVLLMIAGLAIDRISPQKTQAS